MRKKSKEKKVWDKIFPKRCIICRKEYSKEEPFCYQKGEIGRIRFQGYGEEERIVEFKVLVTGAAGFVGREVVSQLKRKNYKVYSTDIFRREGIRGAGEAELFSVFLHDEHRTPL